MSITAIPLSGVNSASASVASMLLSPTINSEEFAIDTTGSIVIGLMPVESGGDLIPIWQSSASAKDTETDGVAGRSHKVVVTCVVDDRDSDTWELLLRLQRTPSHLMLGLRDGTNLFVFATEDSYLCEVNREGSSTEMTLTVHNLMGVQRMV